MHSQNILDVEQSKIFCKSIPMICNFLLVINSTCLGTMHDKTKLQNVIS